MRLQFLGNEIAFAILLLLKIYENSVTAERTCYECHGINCLRTSYNATQNCINDLDICVIVFDGQTVVHQGCLEQISEELRNKCNSGLEVNDQNISPKLNDCFKCNGNLCNTMGSETFKCVQCDSNSDINCHSKPESLIAERCLVSRTPNEYCFTKRKDKGIVRGCLNTLENQLECQSSEDCMICQPSEINNCNIVALSKDGSESEGSGSGDTSSEVSEGGSSGNEGSDGNGNINNGGGSSESGGSSGNGVSGNEPEGSVNDGSGNSTSENGSGGSDNGNNANDNSDGGISGDGVNGSSITIEMKKKSG